MNRRAATQKRTARDAAVRHARRSASAVPNRPAHFLFDENVRPATATRYLSAVDGFSEWTGGEGRADDFDGSDEVVDALLCDYIHWLYGSGAAKYRADNARNGLVMRRPHLKFGLPLSSRALRGWKMKEPRVSYPPINWELAVTIAVQLTRTGKRRHGVAVVLAFDALLRAGELCALTTEDVVDDHDGRIGFEHKGVFLRLRHTKTGDNKSVEVLDPSTIALLRDIVAITTPGGRLFPFTTASLRGALKTACVQIGLSSDYTTHSLRHGGATRYRHVFKWAIEAVMERGRWASTTSARGYIQSGVALLMAQSVPPRIAAIAAQYARWPYAAVCSALPPPPVPPAAARAPSAPQRHRPRTRAPAAAKATPRGGTTTTTHRSAAAARPSAGGGGR